jgi:hypothetical protein
LRVTASSSWRSGADDPVHDLLGGHAVGDGLVGQQDAVAQNVGGDVVDVLGEDELAPPQERQCPGGAHESQCGPGRGTVGDQAGQIGQTMLGRSTGGQHQPHGVVDQGVVDEDGVGRLLQSEELLGGEHRLGDGRGDAHAPHDLGLFPGGGVVDEDLHEEPVPLGLGEGVDTLALEGVLGGHDHERVGHREGGPADGHVPFGHDLQQGRLDLGRRPVDLVGQHDVGEHRAQLDLEGLGRRLVDPGADQVGGDQVGGELQPGELTPDGAGQGLGGQRLGQPRRPLQQAVAPGQQADEEPLGHAVLADHDLLHLEQGPLEDLAVTPLVHWDLDHGNSIGPPAENFLGEG